MGRLKILVLFLILVGFIVGCGKDSTHPATSVGASSRATAHDRGAPPPPEPPPLPGQKK